jgi:cardiolipin synthase (CMP-forming)
MQGRHLPNLITGLRLVLVVPMVWLLAGGYPAAALGLLVLMGLSDAVDGFLAKQYDWRSTLGEYLDPLADKLMLVGTYLTLGWLGSLPVWLVAAVILRDIVIIAGAVAYHFVTHQLEMRPTILSKVNTGAQIALALAVILDQFLPVGEFVTSSLIVIVLVTTVASGLDYVIEWSRRTRIAVKR